MGASVDETALAICVRETLQAFLGDHEGLENASVEVTGSERCTLIDVEGFVFGLTLKGGIDEPDDDADRAKLLADVAPELLKVTKDLLVAIAMCTPNTRHGDGVVHNAMCLGRAVIAKAEGTR